jgi:hypothetical protein
VHALAEEGARGGSTSAHHLVILRLIEQVSSACNLQPAGFVASQRAIRPNARGRNENTTDFPIINWPLDVS